MANVKRSSITFPQYYLCGICGHYHAVEWNGDCREDAARFTCDQLDDKFGPFGWAETDMPE